MDILVQTVQKEGVLALYKGSSPPLLVTYPSLTESCPQKGWLVPWSGSQVSILCYLLAMAGAANAILASPVEMFKVRMQGQYGNPSDKRLRVVAREMWAEWGFRKGIMRGYWVSHSPTSTYP